MQSKMISEYFKPRYGGEREEWMNANTYAMRYVTDILDSILEKNILYSHKEYRTLEHKIWIEKMFEYTHIPCPPKENYEKLHLDVEAWITPQVHSTYPGITDTIHKLV